MSSAIANTNPFQLPIGTNLLQHQVAGHICQEGKDTIGILKDQHAGTVLKAANKPVCGEREIQFYQRVFGDNGCDGTAPHSTTTTSSIWAQLRPLTPQFHGTITMTVAGRRVEFMRLQDITHGMLEPCVMDVKIGARTWDPLATAAKITAERDKYSACKSTLGFCIPGFQVYSVSSAAAKSPQRFGKEFGKSLDRHNVRSVLQSFLNAEGVDGAVHRPLLVGILDGLGAILAWATAQNALRLYSSSILLAYDAGALRAAGETATPLCVQVKMIDFAHAFETAHCDSVADDCDRNYLEGVGNLYALFAQLLPPSIECKATYQKGAEENVKSAICDVAKVADM